MLSIFYRSYFQIPYYHGSHHSPLVMGHQHYRMDKTGKESYGKIEHVLVCSNKVNYNHGYAKTYISGVDYSYNVCMMSGDLEIRQGDRVWLETLQEDTELGLTKDDCYFGAVAYPLR